MGEGRKATAAGRRLVHGCVGTLLLVGVTVAQTADDGYVRARLALLAEIRENFAQTAAETGRPRMSPAVAAALARVPRHEFVAPAQRDRAYVNAPLPIGYGQTISQPYIVALMTELTDPQPRARVLEIGTGSGYQAAVLAELVAKVSSIEIIEPLAGQARERLARLGYANVATRIGDGYYGWPEHAPFDAIIVTAAASHVPPPLIAQLKPGGKMIIPVGSQFLTQSLVLVEKTADGSVRTRQILPVSFVPLTGGH
ncbi:MAG: protein-L-isoaspartate(D-aspartate) O-methyltransferase [Gammaproteobacteria bacterium]|nr:protein-L-isoaspartate(D-aspartate) O-methyltransferase [Gammaproteobacteria bacterium]